MTEGTDSSATARLRTRTGRARAWARRTFWVVVAPALLVLATAGAASAADGSEPKAQGSLSWIKIKDSHGHSIWDYQLSMDEGGITHPDRMFWNVMVQFVWVIYQCIIGLACWLIEWTLSMEWIQMLAGPALVLGDSFQNIIDRFGFTPTLLTITACVVAVWFLRGKWALGIFELGMSLLIAALAVGALSNPVRLVAGEDGLLIKARDIGLEIAVGLQNDGNVKGDPEQLSDELVASFAHTFLRGPHQAINFARIIDGSVCEKTYDKYLGQNDLWEKMEDCNSAYGEVPGNPNPLMLRESVAVFPAGVIVVLFAGVLCLGMLIAGCWALFQSLKMIIALVFALLPGGGRGSLWMTFADLAISLVTLAFTSVFLSAYLLLVQQVFAVSTEGGMKAFYMLDVLLIVGMIVYWKARARLKKATASLAAAMSKRPSARPSALPPPRKEFSATELYYKGKLASEVYRGARNVASALNPHFRDPNRRTGAVPGPTSGAAGPPPDPSSGPRPGPGGPGTGGSDAGDPNGPAPVPAGGGGRDGSPAGVLQVRLEQRRPRQGQQLLNVASTAILAGATGGTSAVASSLVKQGASRAAAQTARRVMVKNKLATGATLQIPPMPTPVTGPPASTSRSTHSASAHPPAPAGPRPNTHEILGNNARGPAGGTDDARAAAAARLQQRLAAARATARNRPPGSSGQ